MKKLQNGMLLVWFLAGGMLMPGAVVAFILIVTNSLLISADLGAGLLSELVAKSGIQIAFTAAVVVSMALFAGMIASRWIGSRSMITLSMLPTGKMWIFAGWVFGGVLMLLLLICGMNFSMTLAEIIYYDAAVERMANGLFVYSEPNALWYSYLRSGVLNWVCPHDFTGWTRFILLIVGAPTVTARVTLGFLADRPLSSLLSLVSFVISCVFMALMPGFCNIFALIVTVLAVIRAHGLIVGGETI